MRLAAEIAGIQAGDGGEFLQGQRGGVSGGGEFSQLGGTEPMAGSARMNWRAAHYGSFSPRRGACPLGREGSENFGKPHHAKARERRNALATGGFIGSRPDSA